MALTDTLKTTLQDRLAQTGGGNLTVFATDLAAGSTDFTRLVGAAELTFTETSVMLAGPVLMVSGKTSLWGVTGQLFRLDIVEQEGGLFFTLYPEAFSQGWQLSEGFSQLQHGLFDVLPQADWKLVATSYDRSFGAPELLLKKGLNYAATVTPAGEIPALQAILPAGTLMQGLIVPNGKGYTVDIQARLRGDQTFAPLGFAPLTMHDPVEIHIVSAPSENGSSREETIFLQGAVQQGPLSFSALLHLPTSPQRSAYGLEPLQTPLDLGATADILGLAGGNELSGIFPDHFSALNELTISAYHINFQQEAPAFASLLTVFSLKPDANQQPRYWPLLSSPDIAIGDLSVAFNPAYHAYGNNQKQLAFSTTLMGHIRMKQGGVNLGVRLFVPLSGSWVLELTDFPTLGELAGFIWPQNDHQKFLGTLPEGMVSDPSSPDLQLKDLQIGFNPITPSFDFVSFLLIQTGVWDIGGIGLKVSGWSVAFKVDAQKNISGLIHGFLQIGSVADIEATFPLPAANGRWAIGLKEGTSIRFPNIGELLTTIGGAGTASGLPQGLSTFGSFEVSRLAILFSPKPAKLFSLAFSMAGTADWVIAADYLVVKNIKANLDISRKGDDSGYQSVGSLEGVVSVFRHDVLLKAFKKAPQDAWKFQIVLFTPVHIPGLTELADWMLPGDMLRFIPPALMPFGKGFELTELNIDFEAGAGSLREISFRIRNSEPWEIVPQYLVVDQASVRAVIGKPAPPAQSSSVHIEGVLRVSTVAFLLTADKLKAELEADPGGGWLFQGRAQQPIQVGAFIEEVKNHFQVDNYHSSVLSSLTINELSLRFNTKDKNLSFFCATTLDVEGKNLAATVQVTLTHIPATGSYTKDIGGQISIGPVGSLGVLHFNLHFIQDQGSTLFAATYTHSGGSGKIRLSDLIQAISNQVDHIPLDLSVDLKDILLIFEKKEGQPTRFLFALDISAGLNLSKLPLIGKEFPPDQSIGVDNLQFILAGAPFLQSEVQSWRSKNLLPAGVTPLPDRDLAAGLSIDGMLNLGGLKQALSLPISGSNTPPAGGAPAPLQNSTPPASPDKAKWFTLQKQLGPVYFERIGAKYENGNLWFLLDASLTAVGLTIDLQGLAVGSPLQNFQPEFRLDGLGIDFKRGPLEIGGAFLRYGDSEYDGRAIIKTEALTLAAIGSYAVLADGHKSLFIYAVLDYPLGGPAFFFVTGLAAGFGYNRRLRIPAIDQVAGFPLVAEAVNGAAPIPAGSGQRNALMGELAKIQTYIPPETGQYFLAVGIKFNSFKLIDSFALLTVSFGNNFELDLLGLSTLVAPAPEAAQVVEPLVEVQMALKASFVPDEGFLGVEAQLTSASFLLSRKCHLTGGFAFYCWFDGPHKGDFVVSVGGYHPAFQAPAHYPKVPRLGFNWQVTDQLSLKGEAYFALTASALMAGGRLEALWVSGNLKAWFIAGADFLIAWKPYHYDARVYVDMGVSYTFHFFGTHTISVDVGADLHIWGPDFSGTAHVKLWIVTFDVTFGAGSSQMPKPIDWTTFRTSFLPASDQDIASISLLSGVKSQPAAGSGVDWIIDVKHFEFETNSVIPIKQGKNGVGNKDFGIAPMGLASGQVDSSLAVVIKNPGGKDISDHFTFEPILKNVPKGLWGVSVSPSLNGQKFITDALTGYRIKLARQEQEPVDKPAPIDRHQFQFSTVDLDNYVQPKGLPRFESQKPADWKSELTRGLIHNSQRDTILEALGFSAADVQLSEKFADELILAPEIAAA